MTVKQTTSMTDISEESDFKANKMEFGLLAAQTIRAARKAMKKRFGKRKWWAYHPKYLSLYRTNHEDYIVVDHEVHDCGTCMAVNGLAVLILKDDLPQGIDRKVLKRAAVIIADNALLVGSEDGRRPISAEELTVFIPELVEILPNLAFLVPMESII